MGAEESKQRVEDEDDQRKKKDSSSSSSSGATALAVGAAVGTALLGVAWGVSRYRANTSDTDQRLQPQSYDDSDSEPEYELESRRAVRGGASRYGANTYDIGQRLQPHGYANSDWEPNYEPESYVPPRITNSFRNLHVIDNKPDMAKNTLKIMTYNVCSSEKYEIDERMKAIVELVRKHSPDFICFQEITPEIYDIFERSSWWEDYYCSMSKEEAKNKKYFCILLCKFEPMSIIKAPIGTSWMGRELCVIETKISNKSIVVATSHLKSACPNPNMPGSQYHRFKRERLLQASEALTILQKYPNVMFCGDMNWNEKTDGEFPLPKGWVDAWTELRGEEKGYTFDTKSNEMLNGRWPSRGRLDRILCNLKGFRLDDIEIIGKEPIPDVTYQGKTKMLPVLPSDHYALLLTVCSTVPEIIKARGEFI